MSRLAAAPSHSLAIQPEAIRAVPIRPRPKFVNGGADMRNKPLPVLALAGACAAALLIASATQPASAAINYNASKSNTAALTAHPTHACSPRLSRRCRGLKTKVDLGHGVSAGKRRHQPVTLH
jgi:hypothetical protein